MNTVKVPEHTKYDTEKRSALTAQTTPEGNIARANIRDDLRPELIVTPKSAQGWGKTGE